MNKMLDDAIGLEDVRWVIVRIKIIVVNTSHQSFNLTLLSFQ